MTAVSPGANAKTLSAAFSLVFCQGRSSPSGLSPDDNDLLNRIRDAVPEVSPAACREALIRVQRLSFDAVEIGMGFSLGEYGEDDDSRALAIAELEKHNPGFTAVQYRAAFEVGLMRAGSR
jgi:hypothetical protein